MLIEICWFRWAVQQFSNILIEIATANKQRNITQHKKSFFSIILIEMATANVQENIT